MHRYSLAMTAVVTTSVALTVPVFGQTGGRTLGDVHFETSCAPEAQRLFDESMLYQHSFWYRASKNLFEEALKADPTCAIAYWGIAQSLLANPFNPTPVKNLAEGLAAIQKGKHVGAKTQRENDLLAAIGHYYTDFDKRDQRTRAQAYVGAMEEVATRYPNDEELQIHYALALNIAARASATGRSRWRRMWQQRSWRRMAKSLTISCTRPTTWSTPTCKWLATARPAQSST